MFLLLAIPACAPDSGLEDLEDADELEAAVGETKIVFASDWSETSVGKLRAGDAIALVYDDSRLPECRGEQGGVLQWAITAFYRINGGEIHSAPVAGLNATPSVWIVPEQKGDLELWFESTNRWGCHAYDSNLGQNYHFALSAPVGQPGWVGNGARVIDRWTCDAGPCDASRSPLENGFSFGTWARQRATIASLYFDVWEEGVTDWDNADLWKQVDAQIHFRFAGQPAFSSRYVDFFRRVGNDARYELGLRSLDPFHALPSVVPTEQCPPATLSVTADGQYVAADVEYYFTADGVELRPAPAQTFKGRFEDYLAPYAACLEN